MAHGSAQASAVNKNPEDIPLLIRALTARQPEEAYRAWRCWYDRANIDQLSWELLQIIPALGGSLRTWLRDDPASGIFHGFVRRAWTEAQIRLTAARSAIDSMGQAGCAPVLLAGPAVVSLLNRREGSVRPIPFLRLVVHRDQLSRASAALQSAGWRLSGELPAADALNWTNCAFYSRNEIGLLLHWRLLPVYGLLAPACEAEFLQHHQSVNCGGRDVLIPAREHILLFALSQRPTPDPDATPWQVDSALLPLAEIDWLKWSALAAAYVPGAFDRLDEMRRLGLDVPKLTHPTPPKPSVVKPPELPAHRRLYRSARRRAARFIRQYLR